MKIKYYLLALTFSFSALSVFAQEKLESEIVMTKSELKSFLETVAQAKRKTIAKKKNIELVEMENRMNRVAFPTQKSETSRKQMDGSISNAELLREVQRLNDRLFLMETGKDMTGGGNGTIFVSPSSTGNVPSVPATPNNIEILEAKAKLDSLQRVADAKGADAYQSELERINKQLNSLQSSINNQPKVENNLDQLKAKYKKFKRTVYFAHDSDKITVDDVRKIDEVAEIVNGNDRLNILVKGFASEVGNPVYNNELSMRRTESVKRALVAQGVGVDQIITIFHGEDFTVADASARRVDMTIQVVR